MVVPERVHPRARRSREPRSGGGRSQEVHEALPRDALDAYSAHWKR